MTGKPLHVSDETLSKIYSLRNQGYTSREIEEKTGVSRERARNILLKAGYPPTVPGRFELTTYNHLDANWVTEFRGFFMGEGSASIRYQTFNGSPRYMAAINISVRDDDKNVILNIHKTLGGTYVSTMHNGSGERSKPGVGWALTGWTRLINFLPLLLEGHLPAKKKRDVEILLEACEKRVTWPYQMSKENLEELHRYYLALRDVKLYKGSNG